MCPGLMHLMARDRAPMTGRIEHAQPATTEA
jgi:hypothetical protein